MRPLRKCGCGIGGDGRNLRSEVSSGGSTIKIASARASRSSSWFSPDANTPGSSSTVAHNIPSSSQTAMVYSRLSMALILSPPVCSVQSFNASLLEYSVSKVSTVILALVLGKRNRPLARLGHLDHMLPTGLRRPAVRFKNSLHQIGVHCLRYRPTQPPTRHRFTV